MRQRPSQKCRPDLERLEGKQPLSASPATVGAASQAPAPAADGASGPHAMAVAAARERALARRGNAGASQNDGPSAAFVSPPFPSNVTGVTLDRITNPHDGNSILIPPFAHVLVQNTQPVPGQHYNLLFISVWNGTKRTFTANDRLTVRLSTQPQANAVPVLTGNQTWVPRQRIVFYALTKQYYPLTPQVTGGFVFNFAGPRVTAIPGPSGIFLRLKYNPATFDKVLDHIVVAGPGAYGHQLGIADTAIWEIIPAGSVIPL